MSLVDTKQKSVRVTVSDPETGAVLDEKIVANDYYIITAGNRYVDGVQIMGKPGRATHLVTIKVVKVP